MKYKIPSQIACFLIVVFTCCSCSKNKEAILLRLKYQKGDEQSFQVRFRAFCDATMHASSAMEATFTVDSVVNNGSQYDISTKINALKTDIDIGGFTPDGGIGEHYDSKKDYSAMSNDEQLLDKQYEAILQPYYAIAFNQLGEVVKPFTILGKNVEQPFGAGIVQLSYPDKKVREGDNWSVVISGPLFKLGKGNSLLAAAFNFTYTIDEIAEKKVVIKVAVAAVADSRVSSLTKNIKANGEYVVDRSNGRVISARIDIPMPNCDNAVISVEKQTDAPD